MSGKVHKVGVRLTVPETGKTRDEVFEYHTYEGVLQVNFFHKGSLVLECFMVATGDYKEEPHGILRNPALSTVIDILSLKAQKHFRL